MSQATDWSVPLVGPVTPTVMATRMDESFDALMTGQRGAARPAYLTSGVWLKDVSGTVVEQYFYDGADDILIGTFNLSANTFTPAGFTAAGLELMDDADAAAQRATLGIGTAATLASDTDGVLSANSDSRSATQKAVKTYVDTAIAGISGADQVARDQIALTNLRMLLSTSVSSGALFQGYQWELASDEWSSGSSGYTFASGPPGYYHNPAATGTTTTSSSSSGWGGAAGTFGGTGNVTFPNSSAEAIWRSSAELTNDFDWTWTQTNQTGTGTGATDHTWQFGVDTAGVPSNNSLYTNNRASLWWVGHDGVGASQTVHIMNQQTTLDTVAAVAIADGDTWTIRRRSGALTLLHNGTTIGTFTGYSNTAANYLVLGQGATLANVYGGVTWTVDYVAGGGNFTLVSPTVSASSAPSVMDAFCLYKDDSGTAVLGTDLTVEFSRDGGTTWTAATITTVAAYDGTYSTIKARVDVSAQPSGTSMKARVKTLNNKAQRVAAPALYKE